MKRITPSPEEFELNEQYKWKAEVLDTKSASFCGAKWFNSSIWLWNGWTTSCHHNPPHQIDLEEIKKNPKALHNTAIKKRERHMMQKGEKPINCQFCWVFEELNPSSLGDRAWLSANTSKEMLQKAFEQSHEEDYDLDYLEIGLERTCNLACSYCCPAISTTWAKDIKKNGPYENLITDTRQHYIADGSNDMLFNNAEENLITDAFFKWWESDLHRTLKDLRITGGEPAMSGTFWKILKWLEENPNKSKTKIGIATNLIYEEEKLDKIIEYASKIDNEISLYTSAESIGEKCEYVRDGFKWELWESNVKKACASPHITRVHFNTTLSAISVDGFLDFLNWFKLLKGKYGREKISISINPVRFPSFQSIIVLPEEIRLKYVSDFNNFITDVENIHVFSGMELDQITRFIQYLKEVQRPHQQEEISHSDKKYQEDTNVLDIIALQKDFKRFFIEYDRRRNKNFIKTFPNLQEWYKNDIQL
jgi:organic radical activating enzyme